MFARTRLTSASRITWKAHPRPCRDHAECVAVAIQGAFGVWDSKQALKRWGFPKYLFALCQLHRIPGPPLSQAKEKSQIRCRSRYRHLNSCPSPRAGEAHTSPSGFTSLRRTTRLRYPHAHVCFLHPLFSGRIKLRGVKKKEKRQQKL